MSPRKTGMASRSRAGVVVGRSLRLRCPRCGEGRLFERWFRMPACCTVCGLRFEREPGYWVGAIYVNYAVTVGLAMGGYFALDAWLAPGILGQLWLWGAFAVTFPLGFFPYSKALWLAVDHVLDPPDTDPAALTPGE